MTGADKAGLADVILRDEVYFPVFKRTPRDKEFPGTLEDSDHLPEFSWSDFPRSTPKECGQ